MESTPKNSGSQGPKNGEPEPNNPQAVLLNNPTMTGILIAVLVIIFTIMYFYIKTKKKGRSILIVGPSEAGKSTLFVKLAFQRDVDTVTSTSPNITEYEVPSSTAAPLILKDLPGHERVRTKFWDSHKVGVRGILCVIDSAGGNRAIREAAEVLYTILSDSIVNSVQPHVRIFCNKQDLPTAKSSQVLQHQLEREITTLRLTKSASLQSTGGGTSAQQKTLGRLDRDFEFVQVLPIKVTFSEGSATSDDEEASLNSIVSWLREIA